MQRQMFQKFFPGRPTGVMRHSRYSNFILFDIFNLQLPRALDCRLSLDLGCNIFLRVLNATQIVLIEVWS